MTKAIASGFGQSFTAGHGASKHYKKESAEKPSAASKPSE